MAKRYYRITNEWKLIIEPREEIEYMKNVTGKTIQFIFQNNGNVTPNLYTHPFTMGGVIGQVTVPRHIFVVARCEQLTDINPEEPDGVIIVDDNKMPSGGGSGNGSSLDGDYIHVDTFNKLVLRLMDIEATIRGMGSAALDFKNRYLVTLAEFHDAHIRHHISEAKLFRYCIILRNKIFAAENLFRDYYLKQDELKAAVDFLYSDTKIQDALKQIDLKLAPALAQMQLITEKLEMLGIQTDSTMTGLHKNFTDLNNALTDMAAGRTSQEISDIFDSIYPTLNTDISGPVRALKETLVKLAMTNEHDLAQDTTLNKAVLNDDLITLTPNEEVMHQISHKVDKPVELP